MNKFLKLSDEQRRNVFNTMASNIGLPAQVLEKDFWVTAVLQTIFALPIAEHLVFKGGTSLSKGWKLIERFSEDIDLAFDPVLLGMPRGSLTKRQIKKLRKSSSLYVQDQLTPMLRKMIEQQGLSTFVTVNAQPNGEGDGTYPEPRQVYIHYKTVFSESLSYLRPDIVLEISARSLLEPTKSIIIRSEIGEYLPIEPITDSKIHTAIPEKTFLEKAFLLHELFSAPANGATAARRSRHLYDLYMMKDTEFGRRAIKDDNLWESIRHHREIYTAVRDVDYTPDVRKRIQLVPRKELLNVWQADYAAMKEAMIYGQKPSFEQLLEAMTELENEFKCHNI